MLIFRYAKFGLGLLSATTHQPFDCHACTTNLVFLRRQKCLLQSFVLITVKVGLEFRTREFCKAANVGCPTRIEVRVSEMRFAD